MLPRTSIVLVLLAACGSSSPSPPVIGATPAAPPPTAWDPATLPRTVAVTNPDDTVTLARVSTAGVEVGATIASPGADRGWLDARTLVGLAAGPDGYVVAQVVDGKRGPDLRVTPAEWPALNPELVLGDGEIWLAGCKTKIEFTDCKQPTYLRLAPGPRTTTDRAPAGRRYGYHGAHLLSPPTGAPSSTMAARVDVARRDTLIDPDATFITCTARDSEARVSLAELFNDPIQIGAFTFGPPQVRWLSHPPLLEVTYAYTDPVEITRQARAMFRPCDFGPMLDYRWLGDGVWAEAHGDGDTAGWTLYIEDSTIGELPGRGLD